LGDNPSTHTIDFYMAGVSLAVVATSELLPPSAALVLDGLVLGVEAQAIHHNLVNGLPLCR
jgi:hypothetical protein